jgi:hypothetical protein
MVTWIRAQENKIWYARKRILYGIQTWGLHHTLAIEATKRSIKNFQMKNQEENRFSKEAKRRLTSLHCCREHNRARSASVVFPHPSAILKKKTKNKNIHGKKYKINVN